MKQFYDFLHNVKTQAVLAFFIVVGGGLTIIYGRLTEGMNNRVLDIMLLTASFYFGASKSSADKDKTIGTLANNQQATVQNADNVNIKSE